jgi:hypothetical protein
MTKVFEWDKGGVLYTPIQPEKGGYPREVRLREPNPPFPHHEEKSSTKTNEETVGLISVITENFFCILVSEKVFNNHNQRVVV